MPPQCRSADKRPLYVTSGENAGLPANECCCEPPAVDCEDCDPPLANQFTVTLRGFDAIHCGPLDQVVTVTRDEASTCLWKGTGTGYDASGEGWSAGVYNLQVWVVWFATEWNIFVFADGYVSGSPPCQWDTWFDIWSGSTDPCTIVGDYTPQEGNINTATLTVGVVGA